MPLVLSKDYLSDAIFESLLFMDSGMFLRMNGGWLDFFVHILWNVSFFCRSIVFPSLRSSVTSRKLIFVLLASTMISGCCRGNMYIVLSLPLFKAFIKTH